MLKFPTLVATLFTALLLSISGNAAPAADATTPYPGTITLQVDMTQAARKLYFVHETIPVKPGPLTLYYPKWLPGYHTPSGPVMDVAGLVFTANGKTVAWRRDLVDMFAIHLVVPPGVGTLDVAFDFLTATHDLGRGDGELQQSPVISDLQWNEVVFYPAGYASKAITIQPNVTLPETWHYATALVPHTGTGGGTSRPIRFASVTLNNLVDSPIISGLNFREVDLAPGAAAPVKLDMVADAPGDLAISAKQVDGLRRLVAQELRMFGAHHYTSYHMLMTLSNHISDLGLEHHQSFDIRTTAHSIANPETFASGGSDIEDILGVSEIAHEFTHSWNGKFRRPYDLWTPDFNSVPMRDDLLWVYEGLTQYWATVMTARAGFWTPAEFRQGLAETAARLDHVPGRTWESLQATADMAPLLYYAPSTWRNWRRGTDFYPEGVLIWLDVDTQIRELSHGKRSLDDFAKRFYGMDDGSFVTRTYTFEDLVDALDQVQPYDWATFLRRILDSHDDHAPLAGITRGGYRLAYADTPAAGSHGSTTMYSVGFSVDDDGEVGDVLWNGPAFKAGLTPGMRIIAVDGKTFSSGALDDAIKDATGSSSPIRLLVKNVEQVETLDVDYHGGLQYPRLERIESTRDYIDQIIAPLEH